MPTAATTVAGPDLDRLVAEALLDKGTWVVSSARSDFVIVRDGNPWMPSTSMAHAWEVAGRMRAIGWDFEISSLLPSQWRVVVRTQGRRAGEYTAATAPLAICLAALRALALA